MESGSLNVWETPGDNLKAVGNTYLTTGDPGIAVRRFPDGELLAQVPEMDLIIAEDGMYSSPGAESFHVHVERAALKDEILRTREVMSKFTRSP